jgi:hypothetical protein
VVTALSEVDVGPKFLFSMVLPRSCWFRFGVATLCTSSFWLFLVLLVIYFPKILLWLHLFT